MSLYSAFSTPLEQWFEVFKEGVELPPLERPLHPIFPLLLHAATLFLAIIN